MLFHYKKELPSERILMATLGDDGDIRYIYVYYGFISKKVNFFLLFYVFFINIF